MSTAVVEQTAAEQAPHSAHSGLGVPSLLGALYVLAAIVFVFGGLPAIWDHVLGISAAIRANQTPVINEFLSGALLLLVMIAVGIVLWYVGRELERRHTQHGLRAGVVFGALGMALAAWLITKIGLMMEGDEWSAGGLIALGVTFAAVLAGMLWLFNQPGFGRWLGRVEDAGWFHALSYKGNQGVRVRRGTIIALMIVGIGGVYSLVTSGMLGSRFRGSSDWLWQIPFTRTVDEATTYNYLPLVHNVPMVVPILLTAAVLWFAWRVVNWPTFADFLIATEAEINKVSWTTRKRLVQDTIVVLVTVFLMTAFLFFIDILWINILTHPWVSVLQVDIKSEVQKQQQKTQW